MTDTPQTDQLEYNFKKDDMSPEMSLVYALRFAAKLERENAALKHALNCIASWNEGAYVGPSFDEPYAALVARAALAAGKYDPEVDLEKIKELHAAMFTERAKGGAS